MKHMILVLIALVLFIPAVASATQQTVTINGAGEVRILRESGWQGVEIHTPSMATNAIDTSSVAGPVMAKLYEIGLVAADTAQTAIQQAWVMYVAFEGSAGTGGSGTVDSMQVALDISNDNRNWTQAQALTLFTNAAPVNSFWTKFRSTAGKGLETTPPFIRVRCKNTGAATGRGYVTITWRKE